MLKMMKPHNLHPIKIKENLIIKQLIIKQQEQIFILGHLGSNNKI